MKLKFQLTKFTPSSITIFLLIGIWLFTLLYSKQYVFLIIIFIFLIGSLVIRKNYLLFLAGILFFSMLLYSPVLSGVTKLAQSNLITLSHPKKPMRLILTPGSGKEVLTNQVLKMLDLIDIHEIPNYQISTKLGEDLLIRQRITESAWPIRRENGSPYYLIDEEEFLNYKDCSIIDSKDPIYLVNCQ
jgi:predicted membrane protein